MSGREIVTNLIREVKQTPDACVTACLIGCLYGLGRDFEELKGDLSKYIVPVEVDNPQNNPLYFWPDGIIKVLQDHKFWVGLHVGNNAQVENYEYKGQFNELGLQFPNYTHNSFTAETFEDYLFDNLKNERYLFLWLDNPIYSPDRYNLNHYEQHVVAVSGINRQNGKATIMDPDIFISGSHMLEVDMVHLFESLWRRDDQPQKKEMIIVVGNK